MIELVYLLFVLLVASNVYWGVVAMKLVNKLMSRNYYEYVQTEKLKTDAKPATQTPDDAVLDPEAERQARDLNSLFGVAH